MPYHITCYSIIIPTCAPTREARNDDPLSYSVELLRLGPGLFGAFYRAIAGSNIKRNFRGRLRLRSLSAVSVNLPFYE